MRPELLEWKQEDGTVSFYGVGIDKHRDLATAPFPTVEDARAALLELVQKARPNPGALLSRIVRVKLPLSGSLRGGNATHSIVAFGDGDKQFFVIFAAGGAIQLPTCATIEQANGSLAEEKLKPPGS